MSMVSDHFKKSTVAALHRERPSIRWACCEWMVQPLVDAGVSKRVIDVLTLDGCGGYQWFGGYDGLEWLRISPSEIPHNVRNCCYKITLPTGEQLFYATDCATLDGIHAEGFDYYFLEANHSRAEIEERIAAKHAAGEFAYEEAAARNHLSREQAEDWLARNAGPNSKYILLHQHIDRSKRQPERNVQNEHDD